MEKERIGYVNTDGWAGRLKWKCLIVGETPKRFRIKALEQIKLPRKWLEVGEEWLVPKYSITFVDSFKENQNDYH